ncbi:MAG TPA: transglycosylase SLT domain-containing protein [Terriglobia bacterium]|jgi:soluble lytic murein transglycosylase-like protein
MSLALTLLLIVTTTSFESAINKAFTSVENNDWAAAAGALDQAYAADPLTFDANNLHYLRGRAAEGQNDWTRARDEFQKIGNDNPLHALASWHAARASIKLHDDAAAQALLTSLPRGFSSGLKAQLAREAGGDLAQKIYQDLSTREARFERARITGDTDTFWSLIHESKDDDVAIAGARLLAPSASSSHDQMELAEVFADHRVFDEALPLYQKASADEAVSADARYQIARLHFQQERYALSIEDYQAIAKDFEGTDWEKDSEYQIANCYWRLDDYPNSEKAYLSYIRKYGHKGMEEAATRNLVDVYRVQGENQKAIATIDRALATQLSVATRQVFQFTKAKILYTQKKYSAALLLFQQLGRTKLRSAAGSATAEEVQYFQALCQWNLGNKSAAAVIWRKLASMDSYYGLRSAGHLTKSNAGDSNVCSDPSNPAVKSAEQDLTSLRHPLRTALNPEADTVSELVFLHLWDEAAFWLNESDTRPPRRAAAEISYLGGEYHRAISLADRLPRTDSIRPLVYPAGYRNTICAAAVSSKVDPLWIHAIIWQESKYDPNSRSGAAARGLMQFIPDTANAVGSSIGMTNLTLDKLFDPSVSIRLGAAYWAALMQKFKSPEMALAAYNGGPDNVKRWLNKSSDPELFVSDIGFVETKKYVMSVFAAHAAYASLANQ